MSVMTSFYRLKNFVLYFMFLFCFFVYDCKLNLRSKKQMLGCKQAHNLNITTANCLTTQLLNRFSIN